MSELADHELAALDDLRDHPRVGYLAKALLDDAEKGN